MEPKDHYNYCYCYWKCWQYTSFMNLLYEFTGEVEFVSVSNSVSIRREWDNKTGSSLQVMAWDLFSFQTSFTHSETRRLNLLTQLCFWKHRFGCISKFRGSACAETNCTPDLIWFFQHYSNNVLLPLVSPLWAHPSSATVDSGPSPETSSRWTSSSSARGWTRSRWDKSRPSCL